MMDTFLLELLLFIFEINTIKKWILSHSNNVILCKLGNILSDLHMYRLILFFFTCLCSLMQLNWNILREMRNDSRFEHFPWKNVRFCLISIVWVHFIQKTEELWFWKPLEYFNIFDKKMMSNLNMFYQAVSDSV